MQQDRLFETLTGGVKVPDGKEDEQESDDDPREVLGHHDGSALVVRAGGKV
jgi:hypothetical protein